jgi:serine/threonine-protein kinase RsbW
MPAAGTSPRKATGRTLVITGGCRGPGWRIVDADPGRGKQVRDWIAAAITRHGCPVDPQDAALAVSELFTNAVVHGPDGGRVLVGYCLWSRGARIVVCDGGGSGAPELRQVTSQAEGGRGLHVVDSVTARWGSFRLAGNLVAWCDFGQPPRAPASDSWTWLDCVLSAGAHLSVPARQRAAPDIARIHGSGVTRGASGAYGQLRISARGRPACGKAGPGRAVAGPVRRGAAARGWLYHQD